MESPPPRLIDERVRAQQVRVIYRQGPAASLVSVLVAATLGLVLWDIADRRLLGAWFLVLVVLAAGRLILVARYRRRREGERGSAAWERVFLLSLVAAGAVLGVGAWLLMRQVPPLHQAVIYFFLMGMAGGAVASYSVHTSSVLATICSVMLPATLWFAVQGDALQRAMAVGGIIYIGAAYRATRILDFFLRRSFELAEELQAAHDREERLARTDQLTGMKNRRAFYELGELAFTQARRYGQALALLMLDVDHFKRINDGWGHGAGDEALKAVAEVIQHTARASDVAGRLGGEEFALLLPHTGLEEAAVLAERLRRAVGARSVPYQGGADITMSASLGVAELDEQCVSLDALVERADAALYEAKSAGRNRVSCHPSPARTRHEPFSAE